MSTVAIIQARLDSARFPNKVSQTIAGQSMLEWVVDRVKLSDVSKVVVATTYREVDDDMPMAGGAELYRHSGDVHDVLGRYAACAHHYRADPIVRITSDCPLIDADLVTKAVQEFFRSYEPHRTYVSTMAPESGLPEGCDVEVFSRSLLDEANRRATHQFEREHVTAWIRAQEWVGRIVIGAKPPLSYSAQHWSVDTPEDLEWVRKVYSYFNVDRYRQWPTFDWKDVMLAVLSGDLKR